MKKIIQTDKAPKAIGPYSQAVDVGSLVFFSGQISIDPETNEVVLDDVRSQTERVMKNISSLLQSADLKFENIVKTTIFLATMNDFATVNEVYGKYFPLHPPARSTVAVAGLPKGVSVEIEVVAFRS
jgi:2-iminobutanoate/2-iminopropanoate deaminase